MENVFTHSMSAVAMVKAPEELKKKSNKPRVPEPMDAIHLRSESEQFPFLPRSSFQPQEPPTYGGGASGWPAPSIPADWPDSYNHFSVARIAASCTVLPEKVTEEVCRPGVIHRLSHPVQVDVSFQNGLWANEPRMVSVLGFGQTRAEALCSFREDLSVLSETITPSSDKHFPTSPCRTPKLKLSHFPTSQVVLRVHST
jgi:hypothetical protein